jgi:hypothetical protein
MALRDHARDEEGWSSMSPAGFRGSDPGPTGIWNQPGAGSAMKRSLPATSTTGPAVSTPTLWVPIIHPGVDRRASSAAGIGPLPADQPPVPAQ